MKYADIHCHLDFQDYEKDFEDILQRMGESEVGAITIGTDLESSRRAVEIAEANEDIWACIGVHPDESSNESGNTSFDEVEFEKLVVNPKVVAIGECGLDYFRTKDESSKDKQKIIFEQQIKFALKHNKPLMLHCRNARPDEPFGRAYDECLDILESYKKNLASDGDRLRGNAHFFAGNIEQARRFLNIGFTMSFTGVITFTHDYDEVIKFLPIESIMSETDAPFVAPVPHRGKRNEPVFVMEVAKRLAEIKGGRPEDTEEALVHNATRIFGLVV